MAELSMFAKTTQKSMEMIKQVQEEAHIEDEHNAFQVMRATLKALRDRLPVDEAVNLGAQLPNLITGYFMRDGNQLLPRRRIDHSKNFWIEYEIISLI